MHSFLNELIAGHPLMAPSELMANIGLLNFLHPPLGFTLVALTWVFTLCVCRKEAGYTKLVKNGAIVAGLLISVQLLIGLWFIQIDIPSLSQLFHMWLASIYIGVLFMLLSTTFKRLEVQNAQAV